MEWVEAEFVMPERPSTRTPGLHLSELIREIERDVLGDDERPAGKIPVGFAEGGFIWEGLATSWASRYWGRGLVQFEALMDGIYLTSDFIPHVDQRVVDFKMSFKSVSSIGKWESKYLGYMVQLKSHCRYFETRKATLLFFFILGDWKRGQDWSGPQIRQIDFEFTDEEIETNWAWVLRQRDVWLKRGGPRPYAAGAKIRGRTEPDHKTFDFTGER